MASPSEALGGRGEMSTGGIVDCGECGATYVGKPPKLGEPCPYCERCLNCGALNPPGHVKVESSTGDRVGRVCSRHTLLEVIGHSSDRFIVDVIVTKEGAQALERAKRKRQGAVR